MTAQLFRPLGAVLACALIVAGGVGWLNVLGGVPLLDAGPLVPGALPLQRLAGNEAQPLVRVLVAWIGAGLVMGAVLAAAGRTGRLKRATAAALTGGVTLVALGALQDAITTSEPVLGHVLPQFTREGLWVAVTVLAACALIPAPPAGTAAAGAGATHRRADEDGAGGHTPRPA
jgi:hypothetical protein